MKLLLTDAGARDASIERALVDLLGEAIAESSALCIPTAGYGGPYADPFGPWQFTSGRAPGPMSAYATDAQTAIKVTGVGVGVSEGHWKLVNSAA